VYDDWSWTTPLQVVTAFELATKLDSVVSSTFENEGITEDAEASMNRTTRSDACRCICRDHFGTRINPAVPRSIYSSKNG